MTDPTTVALARIFWLLDYDGSLCPHREEWEVGHYEPERLRQILDTLNAKSAGLMWNTGRSVDSLRGQSGDFLAHAGFFEHGAYYWNGRERQTLIEAHIAADIVEAARAWTEPRGAWVRLEFKPHSFRLVPVHGRDRSRLRSEFQESSLKRLAVDERGLRESEGWRALEVMVPNVNKANAVPHLVAHDPRFARAVPIAVGDDIADSGVVAEVLARGGFAYLVGNHCGWISTIPHRASQVHFFASPSDLLEFLERDLIPTGAFNPEETRKTKIPHTLLDH